MKSIIISNFHPILVGKLIAQAKLNQYTKFLYHHFQNHPVLNKAGIDEEDKEESESFEIVSDHVDKYAVSRKI